MLPSFLNPLLLQISRRLNSQTRNADGSRNPIRKRHWILGSLVILVGSWITHTTTAMISDAPTATVNDKQRIDSTNIDTSRESNPTEPLTTPVAQTSDIEIEEPLTSVKRTIKRGESLGIIFRKEGLGYTLPHKISQHPVAKQLVSISTGKTLEFKFDQSKQLRQINYPVSALKQLRVIIENDDILDAVIRDLDHKVVQHTVSAQITSSLYESALAAGLSNGTIMEMVRIFGWDVDFVQDIRGGDTFHIIYTDYQIDDKKVADGNILAAEFTTQGQTYRAIRFEDDQGNASFYTPEGESMLGTFLRSPVEFSRISSRFGKRRHPISKKWKAHKGVDYAASRGTPVRATADGNVTLAGRKGGYGKTVILRHAGRFTTLYAHMNGFAKGVRSGSRVKQGQIIGYVGSTGYSTGPHLHYEFRVDGVHRNSLTYKTPKASSVKATLKAKFDQIAKDRGQQLDTVNRQYALAKVNKKAV